MHSKDAHTVCTACGKAKATRCGLCDGCISRMPASRLRGELSVELRQSLFPPQHDASAVEGIVFTGEVSPD
jgi:hypothetical protein